MKQLVIMPGGFHPFHAGHLALYQSALEAFPGADVKVAATNDTSNRPFPFKLKEKLAQQMLSKLVLVMLFGQHIVHQ